MLVDRPTLRTSRKQRPPACNELACELVFRPLAHGAVRVLAPLRVPPPAVVLTATATGAAAAYLIGAHHFIAAALLLQLKTVLDNADGQLARATGRVSAFGRYLDSESDLLVDALLFAALGYVTGHWLLAAVAFCALTIVLSVDYNLERLYRQTPQEQETHRGATAVVARIYALVYAPQDRLVERAVGGRWHNARALTVLANFGLSTQLAALGLCLATGRPTLYLWLAIGCLAALIPLGYWEWRGRSRRSLL